MFRYTKKHALLALFSLFLGILSSITQPVSAVLEQQLIDNIVAGNLQGFYTILWYVALVVLIAVSTYYIQALVQNKFKAAFTQDLRNDLYDGMMRKNAARFREQDTAEYMSVINNDAETVSGNFSSPIWALAGAGFSTLITLVVMVSYSWVLAVVAVGCSLLSFVVPWILTKHIKQRLVERTVLMAALSVQLKETLNGHEVITDYGLFAKIRGRFAAANKALSDSFFRFAALLSGLENSSSMVGKVIKFITFLIAGIMALEGQITIGTVVMFISLYSYFSGGIMLFSQIVPLLKSSLPIVKKVMAIIDDREDAFAGHIEPSFDKAIEIKELSFQYKEGFPVLSNINLTIKKNEKIALIGPSGCGKSTLVKLLKGGYANYQGSICYDGQELRQLDIAKLRKIITVMQQKTYIFNDTIRYNICLGVEFTQHQFEEALRVSGVDQFISGIEGGVDGDCGEDGANLSGGQKQRIALARALIRGVHFLILDEGVSAIDVQTANEIEQQLLDRRDVTLLTITHRIKDGLLDRYDRVMRMDEGRLPCMNDFSK
jgi:ABC-type bacteriocin/lantibiotic exporter with double-glycine peptidase domain